VSRLHAIQEECCRANRLLGTTGLVDLTFGNASVLDRKAGVLAIKPSGVAYRELEPEHMVLVALDGRVVGGDLQPSSDTPTHCRILSAFPGVRSVVHTHSRHAVSFAQAGREIPCLGTTHADYFRGPIPVTRPLTPAEIHGLYEWETGGAIVERFAEIDPLEVPGVLVYQHGPFAWAASGEEAVETARVLELVAELAFRTLVIDPHAAPLPGALSERHFRRKHGPDSYYGQTTK
jgi:L-ribulose-5-phosphate 4-epimerase